MPFKPAASLTEQIAKHLGEEIIKGNLEPLGRIQELRVAKDLGVSRGSVREALLILEGRHLIDIIPRRGAVVSELAPTQRAAYRVLLARPNQISGYISHYEQLLDAVRARDTELVPRLIRRYTEQQKELAIEAVLH